MTIERDNSVTAAATPPPLKIAVLLSGSGRTLQNLADLILAGKLNAKIVLVISSSEKAFGLQRAKNLNLPAHVVTKKTYNTPAALSDVAFGLVRQSQADFVVLAGYLSLLIIPDDFAHRVVNIHPALLPSFGGPGMYGHHVHEAVLAHGCKLAGCTVHFCDQTYDTGPIIAQASCPVLDDDNADILAARVFEKESEIYPQAIAWLTQGRVIKTGKRTALLPENLDVVARAHWLAKLLHENEHRPNTPRTTYEHVTNVVKLLQDDGETNPTILAAAWLHDVLEDHPSLSLDQLTRAFGPDVAKLVDELTIPLAHRKPKQAKHDYMVQHAASMSAAAKRIKLADRLDHVLHMHSRTDGDVKWFTEQTKLLIAAMGVMTGNGAGIIRQIHEALNF